jgi:hypothetical protein
VVCRASGTTILDVAAFTGQVCSNGSASTRRDLDRGRRTGDEHPRRPGELHGEPLG